MFSSLHLTRPSRRALAAVLLVAAAILLVFAATWDSSQPAGERTGGGGEAQRGSGADALDAAALADRVAGSAVEEVALPRDGADGYVSDAAKATTAVAGTTSAVAGTSSALALPTVDAKIVRTAAIDLRVERARFDDAWSAVQSVATGSGGYVISASRSGAGDDARIGTITMRVPSGRFERALERLRTTDGAKVRGLDVSSEDVTQEFVDTRSRLRHDRAVERRLMSLLAEADGVGEVLAVQSRLDAVQSQIEVARGRLQYLSKLTAMSTIQVDLRTRAAKADDEEDESGALATALSDARDRFTDNVAAAVVWFGGALPALLVLAVAAFAARFALRRGRQNPRAEQGLSE